MAQPIKYNNSPPLTAEDIVLSTGHLCNGERGEVNIWVVGQIEGNFELDQWLFVGYPNSVDNKGAIMMIRSEVGMLVACAVG